MKRKKETERRRQQQKDMSACVCVYKVFYFTNANFMIFHCVGAGSVLHCG